MIEAYRQLAEATDHPLHLGRHRGRAAARRASSRPRPASPRCWPRASATPSATASPPTRSRRPAPGGPLLEAMGLRERKNVDLIACPSCGRAEIDVIEVARQAQEAFGDREIPLQVAVMGCVVNGPGEARDADLGIAAGKKQGPPVRPGPERGGGARGRDGRRPGRVGRPTSTSTASTPRWSGRGRRATPPGAPPSATGPSCSTSRAPTPTTASSGSRSSASCSRGSSAAAPGGRSSLGVASVHLGSVHPIAARSAGECDEPRVAMPQCLAGDLR